MARNYSQQPGQYECDEENSENARRDVPQEGKGIIAPIVQHINNAIRGNNGCECGWSRGRDHPCGDYSNAARDAVTHSVNCWGATFMFNRRASACSGRLMQHAIKRSLAMTLVCAAVVTVPCVAQNAGPPPEG